VYISRRQLLYGAGAAAGTAVLAGAGLATSGFATSGFATATLLDPSQLTYAMMLRHAGSTFSVRATAVQKVDVRLTAVRNLSRAGARARPDQCFSLIFEGPGNAAVAAGTYVLEHGELGSVPLFLTPVDLRKAGRPVAYEAVINRLA
jgi:hypothetical protein